MQTKLHIGDELSVTSRKGPTKYVIVNQSIHAPISFTTVAKIRFNEIGSLHLTTRTKI